MINTFSRRSPSLKKGGVCHDARFPICINCSSDVWGNLRSYRQTDKGIIIIDEKALSHKPKNFIKKLQDKEDEIGWLKMFKAVDFKHIESSTIKEIINNRLAVLQK